MPIPNSETLATPPVSPVSPEPQAFVTIGGITFKLLEAVYERTTPHKPGCINVIALHEKADEVTRTMRVGSKYQVTLRLKDGRVVSGYSLVLKDLDVFARINPPGMMAWFEGDFSDPASNVRI
ncbi:hypothetical protein [Acidisoma sp. L85]|uniref:hypothetical protein n=1 Tax=Acidisoma sp. L85 TaxID=1641850 RepID=UPI00131B629B|nr:hypothetical protein [Acidisoma sp. L85]